MKWGTLNVCLLSVLLFNISNQQPFAFTKWYYVQCLAAVLVGLSVVYHFGKYFYLSFTVQPLHGTVQQRELLQFKDGGKFEQQQRNIAVTSDAIFAYHMGNCEGPSNRGVLQYSMVRNFYRTLHRRFLLHHHVTDQTGTEKRLERSQCDVIELAFVDERFEPQSDLVMLDHQSTVSAEDEHEQQLRQQCNATEYTRKYIDEQCQWQLKSAPFAVNVILIAVQIQQRPR